MVEGVLVTIFQMIQMLISNSITTMGQLMTLFEKLLLQLGFITQVGGPVGLAVALIVLALVVFFLGRYVMGVGRGIVILFILGVAIAVLIAMSLV